MAVAQSSGKPRPTSLPGLRPPKQKQPLQPNPTTIKTTTPTTMTWKLTTHRPLHPVEFSHQRRHCQVRVLQDHYPPSPLQFLERKRTKQRHHHLLYPHPHQHPNLISRPTAEPQHPPLGGYPTHFHPHLALA